MEGLTLPCSIGFKWPRVALPCQCLIFNALSGLMVVAKLLTEDEGAGSNTSDYCNSFLFNIQYSRKAQTCLITVSSATFSINNHSLLCCVEATLFMFFSALFV